jgi:hypothetical protein
MSNKILQALFKKTVEALQAEIPALGQTVVADGKHIYAWVKENNPREFIVVFSDNYNNTAMTIKNAH